MPVVRRAGGRLSLAGRLVRTWPTLPPSDTAKLVSLIVYRSSFSSLLSLRPLLSISSKKKAATEKKLIFEAFGFLLSSLKAF